MYRSTKHRRIDLRSEGWALHGVRVLTSPIERFRGIGAEGRSPVMLLTRSVHSFTVGRPIGIVVVDLGGTVVDIGVLHRRRVIDFGTPRWVVETEVGIAQPAPGDEVVASASTMSGRCPEH